MIRYKKQLNKYNAAEIIEHLNKYVLGSDMVVYIVDRKQTRSIPQNKYYWGVVIKCISEHTGINTDELHEILKYKFNSKQYRLQTGEVITVGLTTTKMKKAEFSVFIDLVRNWSKESLNHYIPTPEELSEQNYVELIEDGLI